MKKTAVRMFAAIVTLCMLIAMMAGCQTAAPTAQPAESAAPTTAPAEATTAPEATPAPASWLEDTTPITFTAIMHPQLAQNKWGEDAVSKYITEKLGITLDVTFQSTWDDKQLSTMLASGEKLPDFIVCGNDSTAANALVQQGFVQPLNKLAEQYCPEFFNVLPKDMDKIYGEPDGNLYCVGDMFGDNARKSELKVSGYVDSGIAVQSALLDKIGNPAMDTLEDFKNVCLKIKEAYPELHNVIALEGGGNAIANRSLAQIVNRFFGGQNQISVAADGTAHLNFRDESYISALKYIRELYSLKLIPVESFTMSGEQMKQALVNKDVFAYFGFYYNLGQSIPAGFTKDTPYWAIEPPTAPSVSRDAIKLPDQYDGIGGWHATHISKDCKDPKRAIRYITFMLSEEGQVLQRLGVQDSGWVQDPNGGMAFSPRRKELAQVGPDKLATELGIDNWNWCWFEEFYIIMVGEELVAKDMPAMADYYNKYAKYAGSERLNNMAGSLTDTDMQVLRTKIDELWNNEYAKMVLAPTEEEMMAEYNKFLEQAETLGLSKLEQAYTENYKAIKAKLGQ